MNNLIKSFIPFLIVSLLSSVGSAQNTNIVGVNFIDEFSDYEPMAIHYGISFEQQKTVHLGYETGLYFRPNARTISYNYNGSDYEDRIVENYLSIPILAKYYTGFVNLSFGPSIDYYLGAYRLSSTLENSEFVSSSRNPILQISAIGKISKTIRINESFFLEPEVRAGLILGTELARFGFGLNIKYQF